MALEAQLAAECARAGADKAMELAVQALREEVTVRQKEVQQAGGRAADAEKMVRHPIKEQPTIFSGL